MKSKSLFQTKPDWGSISVFFLVILIISCLILFNVEEPRYPPISFEHMLLVVCIGLFTFFKTHVVTKECLIVKLLGIPIRKIPWSKVSAATFVPHRNKAVPEGSVYITIHPAKPYIPNRFALINPFRTIRVHILYQNKQQCMDALYICLDAKRIIIREHSD